MNKTTQQTYPQPSGSLTNHSIFSRQQAIKIISIGFAIIAIGFIVIPNYLFYEIYVYNGLGTSIEIHCAKQKFTIHPYEHKKHSLSINQRLLTATTLKGDTIEVISTKGKGGDTYIYNVAKAGIIYSETIAYHYGHPQKFYSPNFTNKRWSHTTADFIFENPESLPKRIDRNELVFIQTIKQSNSFKPSLITQALQDLCRAQESIRAHILWDDPDDNFVMDWLSLSYILDDGPDVLRTRLEKNGHDLPTYLNLMNLSNEEKQKTCKLAFSVHEKDSMQQDFQYLKAICLEPGAKRDNLFLNGYKKWPEHSWLALAAGNIYTKRKDWSAAVQAFEKATINNPLILQTYGKEIERIRRYAFALQGIENNPLKIHLQENQEIAYLRGLETISSLKFNSSHSRALSFLSNGELQKAFEENENDIPMRLLIVASKGADKKMEDLRDSVFAHPEKRKFQGLYSLIAMCLARRDIYYKKPLKSNYEKALKTLSLNPMEVEAFILAVKNGDISQANKWRKSIEDLYSRAVVTMMGIIFLKEHAPKNWILEVNSVLFVDERPYFGEWE